MKKKKDTTENRIRSITPVVSTIVKAAIIAEVINLIKGGKEMYKKISDIKDMEVCQCPVCDDESGRFLTIRQGRALYFICTECKSIISQKRLTTKKKK